MMSGPELERQDDALDCFRAAPLQSFCWMRDSRLARDWSNAGGDTAERGASAETEGGSRQGLSAGAVRVSLA